MGEKKFSSWAELIEKTSVKDLILETHSHHLITLSPHQTLSSAIDTLNEAKILSAPVVDIEKHSLLGLLDSLDIMSYIVSHWRSASLKLSLESFPSSEFFKHPVSEVINFSKKDFPRSIVDSASVKDLIGLFTDARPSGSIHRVVVLHGAGSLIATVSQTDLVKFLARHIDLVKSDQTIEELGLSHIVVVAKASEPAHRVLELLLDHQISGVALTADDGKLIGNLSATDFRGFKPTSVDYFLCSAGQFSKSTDPADSVAVLPTHTFKQLIARILHHHVHRCYVVTDDFYPVGVIALTDIVRYISQISSA